MDKIKVDKNDMLRKLIKNPLSIAPEVRESLPKELLDEICLYSSLNLERKIIKVIESTSDRMMALNNIVVALSLLTGGVVTRKQVSGKLNRMIHDGFLIRAEGYRGVYILPKGISHERD